ncbi:MAG TPA: DUF6328 family protein [Labilithrix sp.]
MDEREPRTSLKELLEETRILLPGTQVFLSILLMLPFTTRFVALTSLERHVYLCTVFSTLLALACFVTPAAYHRLAYPVHHRISFKLFANWFLVAGLVPFSASIVLTTYLVTSVVAPNAALAATIGMGLVIGALWWLVPIARAHDWYGRRFRPGPNDVEP